jgi:antirestriction protein ArdC
MLAIARGLNMKPPKILNRLIASINDQANEWKAPWYGADQFQLPKGSSISFCSTDIGKLASANVNPDRRRHDIDRFIMSLKVDIKTEMDIPGFHILTKEIRCPHFKLFDSADAYYGVIFHELGHLAHHEIDVDHINDSLDEIVAEITSFLMCDTFGIDSAPSSGPYIRNFLTQFEPDVQINAIRVGIHEAIDCFEYLANRSEKTLTLL